ncbi:MAG TPA: glycoside hydrolase family 16 protein [Acidobacteriaceae bacterium]|jgi:hypothetical protein|nr:glycoside hydrolase family 16 protein [Acidobacteriaceae bacterium]
MSLFSKTFCTRRLPASGLLLIAGLLLGGCRPQNQSTKPRVQLTQIPSANPGGPAQLDYIAGTVTGAKPGQQIVLYARSGGVWWIQPYVAHSLTRIQADSTWKNETHLGTEYAALLVEPGYHPISKTVTLPAEGDGVAAEIVANGQAVAAIVPKLLHFSGYEWTALAAGSDRGGESNIYDPANAWVDEKGYLHLKMGMHEGKWTCAEVNLNRSLGYGTYRFVVQDSAHLEPSAVLGLFTLDLGGSSENRSEIDVELSRWGNPGGKNAQYVIQPFYVPENVSRFTVPAGPLTHSFQWEPGVAAFKSVVGSAAKPGASVVGSHTFTAGVPSPAAEKVHIDLFDFHHSRNQEQRPSEVVIEKFEYLP